MRMNQCGRMRVIAVDLDAEFFGRFICVLLVVCVKLLRSSRSTFYFAYDELYCIVITKIILLYNIVINDKNV